MSGAVDAAGAPEGALALGPSASWRESLLDARRNRNLWIGTLILAAMVGVGILGLIGLPDPNAQDLTATYLAPGSAEHPLGTDGLGRDVLAWVSAGIWISLFVAVVVVTLSAIVGVAVGLSAGYFGGAVDALLMRLVDLELAVPPLLLFIAASAALTPSMGTLIVLLSVAGWLPYARLIRNVTLVERERGYVAAARLAGATRRRVVFVHLLPAASTTALVLSSLEMGLVLLWEAGLSFLGLGVNPPHNSLGFLINEGRSTLSEAWWVVVSPGVAVALLVLAFNLIGDGLRDAVHRDVDVIDR
jgi:peptide/nickel transport system permease protein